MPSELEREDLLDEVIAGFLRGVKEGYAPSRQQLLERHPELAEDLSDFFADQDRFKRMAAPLRQVVPPESRFTLPRRFGNYELLEELVRGGMGVVFKARQFLATGTDDQPPFRLVALKLLLGGPLASEEDLRRFRIEAEIISSLNHHEIVPIYEVGAHDGQLFISMKLIEGGSLVRHRERYRDDPVATARLLAVIADAVHHAHQRGILHRDLKPANILLEPLADSDPPEWVPYVTDFGLARRYHRPENGPRSGPSMRTTLYGAPTNRGGAPLTRTGDIVGTPSFMAPEQASGKLGAVTTAADVYGLGAILYDLLTGRPPFQGATPLETVWQLLHEEPSRPRTLCKTIDRDLETICLKCLHKDPERRYTSARELADDLRRYLRGEPILARAMGRAERILRWARKNKAVACLSSGMVLILVGGGVICFMLWMATLANLSLALANEKKANESAKEARENLVLAQLNEAEAKKQREAAEVNQRQADANFHLAHGAFNTFFTDVSEQLANYPGLQRLRKRMLQHALDYCQDFLKERGRTPELLREQAETYTRLAFLHNSNGDKVEARKADEKAVTLFRELQQGDPTNLHLQCGLATSIHNVGVHQETHAQAVQYFQESLVLYNRFLTDTPADLELLAGKALTLSNLGIAAKNQGQLAESRTYQEEALRLLRTLVADHPDSDLAQKNLAATLRGLGELCRKEPGHAGEALGYLRERSDLLQKLAQAQPRNYGRQAELCGLHLLALAQRDCNQRDEAARTLNREVEVGQQLARDNPDIPRYLADLATAYTTLGSLTAAAEKARALTYFQQARDLLQQVVRVDSNNPDRKMDLGLAYYNIGVVQQGHEGHQPETRLAFQQAREIQEELVKAFPATLDYRWDLARTLSNLGLNLGQAGNNAEAVLVLHQGIEHQLYAYRLAPQHTGYRNALNSLYGSLAESERFLSHFPEALAATQERQKLWPSNPVEQYRCALDFGRTAQMLARVKATPSPEEQALLVRLNDLAMSSLRRAVQNGFKDVKHLQNDRDLDGLRPRPEFKELLAEVEKKKEL